MKWSEDKLMAKLDSLVSHLPALPSTVLMEKFVSVLIRLINKFFISADNSDRFIYLYQLEQAVNYLWDNYFLKIKANNTVDQMIELLHFLPQKNLEIYMWIKEKIEQCPPQEKIETLIKIMQYAHKSVCIDIISDALEIIFAYGNKNISQAQRCAILLCDKPYVTEKAWQRFADDFSNDELIILGWHAKNIGNVGLKTLINYQLGKLLTWSEIKNREKSLSSERYKEIRANLGLSNY